MPNPDKEKTARERAREFLLSPKPALEGGESSFAREVAEILAAERRAANEARYKNALPGEKMPDGTICAGVSPETGKLMFTTPADMPELMDFNKAAACAKEFDAHGHKDWRVPTDKELSVLFNNRTAIGGFNLGGSTLDRWYWSSTPVYNIIGRCQRLSDGNQNTYYRHYVLSVRCVR
jgi:hypothetical protein